MNRSIRLQAALAAAACAPLLALAPSAQAGQATTAVPSAVASSMSSAMGSAMGSAMASVISSVVHSAAASITSAATPGTTSSPRSGPATTLKSDATSTTTRSGGVQVTWLELATVDGVAGNAHVGSLDVVGDDTIDAYGSIIDWTCPAGSRPPFHPNIGGESEPTPTDCTMESIRSVTSKAPIALTTDDTTGAVHATGQVVIVEDSRDAGEPVTAALDLQVTVSGPTKSTVDRSSWTGEDNLVHRLRTTSRMAPADVTGHVGAMSIDTGVDEESEGQLIENTFVERISRH